MIVDDINAELGDLKVTLRESGPALKSGIYLDAADRIELLENELKIAYYQLEEANRTIRSMRDFTAKLHQYKKYGTFRLEPTT